MRLSTGIVAMAAGIGVTGTYAAEATRAPFGTTPDGVAVEAVTLRASDGISARIITYGATLQALFLPDRMGRSADVVLGYDGLADYVAKPQFFGSTVGRYANRIAGARFTRFFERVLVMDCKPGARALEIGTGSGYGAAVLSRIAAEVYTVERIGALAAAARDRLARLGYANVQVREGDGSLGSPEHAPYDAILVTASGPRAPRALLRQLAVGGRLVMPVGGAISQRLVRVTRTEADEYEHEDLEGVAFVPLIGAEGWPDETRGE